MVDYRGKIPGLKKKERHCRMKELLTDIYARTVKDNEEDFATMYYIVWKMANLMLIKG